MEQNRALNRMQHRVQNRGIGHIQQKSFFAQSWQHRYSHGGSLRNQRAGRGQRPLSTKAPLHLVFKVNRKFLRHRSLRSVQGFPLILFLLRKYSQKFAVRVEQLSIQHDHIHALVRTAKRSQFQKFFRVVAGQIAQQFQKHRLLSSRTGLVTDTVNSRAVNASNLKLPLGKGTGLWRQRPFTRVVNGWRAYSIVRNYIQLNEQEVLGKIRYQKHRLRGLSTQDWEILWIA